MGLSKLEEITTNLLKNGMDANTPVAVVSSAASTKQQTCEATLNTIHEKVKQEKLSSPSVIVVGEVVKTSKTDSKTRRYNLSFSYQNRRSAIKVSADIKRSWI